MSVRDFASKALIDLEERYGANNYNPLDVVLTRGQGVWVWDVDGRKYLDCLAAYSAVNQGHNHPRIVEALVRQAQRLALTSRAFRNDQLGAFYEEVCGLTGFERVLPMNTGAEAVETAIKAARKWGYTVKGVDPDQAEIIVFTENFHGRTTTIISFSSAEDYREGFGPLTPGFKMVPYGDPDAVGKAITPNTVAVLMEPVQGEGGVIIPPRGTLSRLREICDRERVLLILDEIQTGLGRTGKMFAFEHEEIRPDGLTLGKAMSGGLYPVSAFLADGEVMDVFHPGQHGSTYGGNPLAAAVATEALRVLVDEGLADNSAALGGILGSGLRSMAEPVAREVRQIGLWVGIELDPQAGGARRFTEALKQEGVLCKGTHEHTIRIAPPLVITKSELEWALERFEKVFRDLI